MCFASPQALFICVEVRLLSTPRQRVHCRYFLSMLLAKRWTLVNRDKTAVTESSKIICRVVCFLFCWQYASISDCCLSRIPLRHLFLRDPYHRSPEDGGKVTNKPIRHRQVLLAKLLSGLNSPNFSPRPVVYRGRVF